MTTAFTDASAPPAPGRARSQTLTWTSVLFSFALLAASIWFADSRRVLAELSKVDARWLGVAFLISVAQLFVLGARYAHIARATGLEVGWLRGTTEYALSVLVNQVVPTGVLGDGLRAARQAQRSKEPAFLKALEAVALDRLAGFAVLWVVAVATAPLGPGLGFLDFGQLSIALVAVLALLTVLGLAATLSPRVRQLALKVADFLRRSARVLLLPSRVVVHAPLSLLLIGLLLTQLWVAARAVGVELEIGQMLWLGPLLLLAMSAPSFFAGWGVREGASALLFGALGMAGSTGVAVALVFGAFTLIASLPGAVVVLFDAGRDTSLQTRWGQAHSLAMLASLGLAVWSGFPALVGLVATLSLLILVVQSRASWTPSGHFGLANTVTAARLAMTAALLLGATSWSGALLAGLAVLVLLLDVADGWLARRQQSSSEFGAQFDVEVDTLLVAGLTLSLLARGQSGYWVLVPIVMRYVYVLAPVFVAPVRQAPSRTIGGRAAYVFMIAAFITALVVPNAWAYSLTLAGATLVSLSLLGSFRHSYAASGGL